MPLYCIVLSPISQRALLEILDEAMKAGHASFGNVQLRNPWTGDLEVVASRGFDGEFLHFFRAVAPDCPSACGRALRLGQRVLVRDVAADPYFTPFLQIARRAGFRSVQSTPLHLSDGRVAGIISTHFKTPRVLSQAASDLLDRCAMKAARLIESERAPKAGDPKAEAGEESARSRPRLRA
jgi:GAF domain-containing protein